MTTMTTIDSITDEQIEQLRDEAACAGDREMYIVCTQALDRLDPGKIDERYRAFANSLTTVEAARRECVRVIRDAEAMAK